MVRNCVFFAHVDGSEYFRDEKVIFVYVFMLSEAVPVHTHHVIDIKLGKEKSGFKHCAVQNFAPNIKCSLALPLGHKIFAILWL